MPGVTKNEPPLDREEYGRWRSEAERALESARREGAADAHNWSCFLAEQSARLALKALLHGLGRGPWGHDLIPLGEEVGKSGIEVSTHLQDALARLSRHYIPARYPDAHPAGSAASRYRGSDATAAIADAEQVLRFADESWRSLGG